MSYLSSSCKRKKNLSGACIHVVSKMGTILDLLDVT
jgi:hypothetical protein